MKTTTERIHGKRKVSKRSNEHAMTRVVFELPETLVPPLFPLGSPFRFSAFLSILVFPAFFYFFLSLSFFCFLLRHFFYFFFVKRGDIRGLLFICLVFMLNANISSPDIYSREMRNGCCAREEKKRKKEDLDIKIKKREGFYSRLPPKFLSISST